LYHRTARGGLGGSNAWKSCFFARLRNGDQAQWYLNRLIGRNAFPNLMNGCWPGRVFQIDGNFAGESICHAKSQRAVFRVPVRISWHTHTLENSGP